MTDFTSSGANTYRVIEPITRASNAPGAFLYERVQAVLRVQSLLHAHICGEHADATDAPVVPVALLGQESVVVHSLVGAMEIADTKVDHTG